MGMQLIKATEHREPTLIEFSELEGVKIKTTYTILSFVNEDSFWWYCKGIIHTNRAGWEDRFGYTYEGGIPIPKKVLLKEVVDKTTGKLKSIYRDCLVPPFIDWMRNQAVTDGRYDPFEEGVPPISEFLEEGI